MDIPPPVVEVVPLAKLQPWAKNPRKFHAVAQIARSVQSFGYAAPILVQKDTYRILAGHGRLEALKSLGVEKVPVLVLDMDDDRADLYTLADNKLTESAEWDFGMMADLLLEFDAKNLDVSLTGFSQTELEEIANWTPGSGAAGKEEAAKKLSERFLVPPFSVLDARQGYWQERKRAWVELGIRSEIGRGGGLLGFSEQARKGYSPAFGPEGNIAGEMSGTSIFDPVLCELAYLWFSGKGMKVLDPFAGGSVRGIVAARLGREYHGVDLSGPQIAANRQQAAEIGGAESARWTEGDSANLENIAGAQGPFDLVFSCPPYADLERYSEDARDLSTMAYPAFRAAYRSIIRQAVALLREDRFACFVVGEVRSEYGAYYGFVPETISAFEEAGARFYNEAILVTAVGSLPIRIREQFTGSRKLGKTHQNLLVFVKGDPKKATACCGEVAVEALDDFERA